MKTAIIVSTGRTGTQFLATYFDQNYDDVVALHEPKPSYALRMYSHAYLAGRVSEARMAAVLRRKRLRLMRAVTASTYIESNGYLQGFIPVLHEVWPDPTLIHVVRDPRTYVVSALSHQEVHLLKKLFNQFVPWWLPDVRSVPGKDTTPNPIGYYSAFWRYINDAIRRNAEKMCGGAYHTVRYESVFGEDHAGLQEICTILSLPYKSDGAAVSPGTRINKSRSSKLSHWRTWPPARCAELHRICSPLMQEYGYGQEDAWLARVAEGERDGALSK